MLSSKSNKRTLDSRNVCHLAYTLKLFGPLSFTLNEATTQRFSGGRSKSLLLISISKPERCHL